MARYVGVAIAARQLGVNRVTLQKLIRNGDLLTFEGKVDVEELRKSFPGLALNRSPVMEKVEAIKESAYGSRVQEVYVPTVDSLQSQIKKLKTELNIERLRASTYEDVIRELLDNLAQMQAESCNEDRDIIKQLNIWLLHRFENRHKK